MILLFDRAKLTLSARKQNLAMMDTFCLVMRGLNECMSEMRNAI